MVTLVVARDGSSGIPVVALAVVVVLGEVYRRFEQFVEEEQRQSRWLSWWSEAVADEKVAAVRRDRSQAGWVTSA